MTSPNTLTLKDILNDTTDVLELKDDVVLWSFQYGFLLTASQTQCFIFKENNWNCPITVDLREKCPQFIKQSEKYINNCLNKKSNLNIKIKVLEEVGFEPGFLG